MRYQEGDIDSLDLQGDEHRQEMDNVHLPAPSDVTRRLNQVPGLKLAWLPRDFVKKLKYARRSCFLGLLVWRNIPVFRSGTAFLQITCR